MKHVYTYRAFDTKNLKNDNVFKVNEYCLKAYFDNFPSENESFGLNDLVYKEWLLFLTLFLCFFFVWLFFILVHFQPWSNGGYLYSMTLMSIFLISHDNLYLFIYLFNYLFFLFSINLFSTSHLKNGQHSQEIKNVFFHFASKYDNKNLLYLMWKIKVVN